MNTERRLRILLVEDDAIFAAVTAEVMRERALVRWTPTAESAIAAAGEAVTDPPDRHAFAVASVASNCCSSVDPRSASVEVLPAVIVSRTWSK